MMLWRKIKREIYACTGIVNNSIDLNTLHLYIQGNM